MMFYPIEFIGLWKPYIGWQGTKFASHGAVVLDCLHARGVDQGIVPMKAAVMAGKTVDLLTTKLISLEDVFARLDPNKVASLLGPALHSMLANLIAGVAQQHSPAAWNSMPER